MKLSAVTLTICCLLLSTSVYAQTCQADYQCGTIPYGYCNGSNDDCPSTNGGLALDTANNVLYYIADCRYINAPAYTNQNNYTIKKVSTSGGIPTTIYTQQAIPAAGNLDKVYAVANGNLYYDRFGRSPGNSLYTFNLGSKKESFVGLSGAAFYTLDISQNSYTCELDYRNQPASYEIFRYSGAVSGSSNSGLVLYNLSSTLCGPVRRGNGNDIIFTAVTSSYVNNNAAYTTTFYKGSVVGSKTLPSPLFVVQELVNDFEVDSSGAIVYGTSSGLYRRVGTTTTTIVKENVIGVVASGQTIYYNNGATIRSVNQDGNAVTTVVQPSTGSCTCRPGFYGSNCQSCNGQIQWVNGIPSCVPVDSNGDPQTCSADYQCSNQPFKVCGGSCICRRNFTGPKCDQCPSPYTFSYQNGVPTCQ